ncbi:hypothetical protein C8R47DRAFT_1084319 [Mycena vitilis]|nr:hypothetical protein C8R47DRAFT_1084319 [Mycena vitilis]
MDERIAITTPRQLPLLTTVQEQQETWAILNEIVGQGFSVDFELPSVHKCGTEHSCPATLRRTGDEGWMQARLPRVHYGQQFLKKGCTWSMFASGCMVGILKGGALSTTTEEEDSSWRKIIKKLLVRGESPGRIVRI